MMIDINTSLYSQYVSISESSLVQILNKNVLTTDILKPHLFKDRLKFKDNTIDNHSKKRNVCIHKNFGVVVCLNDQVPSEWSEEQIKEFMDNRIGHIIPLHFADILIL